MFIMIKNLQKTLVSFIGYIISYDYNKNILYYKYYDNNNKVHFSLVIN